MQKLLSIASDLYNQDFNRLIHAPFPEARNITPFASLDPKMDYDFALCRTQECALFAAQDKAETLGLIAKTIQNEPKNLAIIWPNDKGGKGLIKHLQNLNVSAHHEAKAHTRFAFIDNFEKLNNDILEEWIGNASPKPVPNTKLKAQAGLFSWRSIDPASKLLLQYIPALNGSGADFGAGWGYLSHTILQQNTIEKLDALEVDFRAINLMVSSLTDKRFQPIWTDVTRFEPKKHYDFIVMNPPFHMQGQEDKSLGQRFIEKAAQCLKKGGALYMVANRHLPYEHILKKEFQSFDVLADQQGYKVIRATR